jgi:hypothetical protein
MFRWKTNPTVAAALLAGAAMLTAVAHAQSGGLVNTARNGLAIKGYDPVSYFDGAPAAGRPELEHVHDGVRYRFATAANRDRFAQEPARHLPQYGGFCAWAVSRGYTADVDPLAWAVVDGRLYLNYSKRVQRMWQEDVPGNILKADANWPALRDKSQRAR